MKIEEKISAFISLGKYLKEYVNLKAEVKNKHLTEKTVFSVLENAVSNAEIENPWFTRENIFVALENISISLDKSKLDLFIQPYSEKLVNMKTPGRIGVVMAGNIPLVGFHDFLCVLLSGHRFLGKSSSQDSHLLPAIAELLIMINPDFGNLILFSEERLTGFDAIIASGSNNSYRYFEYYFGKYPHILRKNRNGVAILSGTETGDEMAGIADDIFIFFGRGCRSISKLYLPEHFDFELLAEPLKKYSHYIDYHKYGNNYNYYKAIYLLDKVPFIDIGHALLVENSEIASPVSVIYYEYYQDLPKLKDKLTAMEEQIQCIVCRDPKVSGSIKPGQSQHPELWDYADGIDTMEFLLNLQLLQN
jgi:hypothetical protein